MIRFANRQLKVESGKWKVLYNFKTFNFLTATAGKDGA